MTADGTDHRPRAAATGTTAAARGGPADDGAAQRLGGAEPRLFTRGAAAASCAGFVLIGALQALYGPAIPALRSGFGLSPAAAGLGLSLHFAGGVAGVLAFNAVHARVGNRVLLASAYALMAAGGAGFALAGSWPLALAAAFLGGLGFGGLDYGLNQLFAVGFGSRGTAMLNILNAFFGIGAVAGPALLAALGPDRYPYAFAGCAALAAALACTCRGVRNGPGAAPDAAPASGAAVPGPHAPPRTRGAPATTTARKGGLLSPVLLGFLALYVLNVAVEAGTGAWEPTHLETVGRSASFAASATSLYWLMMTAGRFLVVPLAARHSAERIITVCSAGMTGCLLLALVDGAAPVAYAGVGLFIAPVFPTGLVWLQRSVPRARRAGAWVIAASMAGGVAAPPALGQGIEAVGIAAVPWLLSALSAAGLAVTAGLIRSLRGTPRRAVPGPPAAMSRPG